ncbi:MAG: ATP-binding cassette domain-containing protein [Bacteroidaceae bacterium]|nr:ATP-binding cassette domain-containing protein [Bacteroidaceae bacterium]
MITITNASIAHPDHRLPQPVSLCIGDGEQVAIVGANAVGKSRLVDLIVGQWPLREGSQEFTFSGSRHQEVSRNVKFISFRDSYGDADSTYYLQQRWNQHDIDDDAPTVAQLLQRAVESAHCDDAGTAVWQKDIQQQLLELFHLEDVLDKYVISLSSGELRKLQLIRVLLTAPRLLVINNPFIGLDAEARVDLVGMLTNLIITTGMQVLLVVSRVEDIPSFITHVIPVTIQGEVRDKREWHSTDDCREEITVCAGMRYSLPVMSAAGHQVMEQLLQQTPAVDGNGEEMLKFSDVSIKYGDRTILDSVNWTVRRGERWALTGPNGSGKSTLLSLVCADNPQAYACSISLFGKQRGTGESIWDIKRHIGYVSPEMHRAYLRDLPAIDIVASGLSDSVGLYHRPRTEERKQCKAWMKVFGIDGLADRKFLHLSSGEQRLCLVARAFVKNPDLLILDEPLHGLDNRNRTLVKEVIAAWSSQPNNALIMVTHYIEDLPNCITNTIRLCKKI